MVNNFINLYKATMQERLCSITEYDENYISKFLDKIIEERLIDPKVELHNNYTKQTKKFTINKFSEIFFKKDPIITTGGTMFQQHEGTLNLPALMLEDQAESRKINKKLMFEAHIRGDKDAEEKSDLDQKSDKLFMNSFYGILGQQQSAFFNLYSAEAITSTGRSIITSALMTFEGILNNNIYFYSLDDCFKYIDNIYYEDRIFPDEPYIEKYKSVKTVVKYLISKFHTISEEQKILYADILTKYLSDIDLDIVNRIYLKNNLSKFVNESKFVQDIIDRIVTSGVEYKDANKVPEKLEEDLKLLKNVFIEFIYYNYPYFDAITFKNNLERKSVVLIDTDSTMINLEPWVDLVYSFVDVDQDDNNTLFRIINIIIYILTNVIAENYDSFTKRCNIKDGSKRKLIAMKNEFLFKRIQLSNKKKCYSSLILLKEGVEMNPPKFDIKGLAFNKVNVNKSVRKYLSKLVREEIMDKKEIDISSILERLEYIEIMITESFKNNEVTYMKPSSVKAASSYKAPLSIGHYRAVHIWNSIYPNQEINLPNEVYIVKMDIDKLAKISPMYDTDREVYDKIKEKIFEHETLSKSGIKAIAIPRNLKILPNWILNNIKIDDIIEDIMKCFTQVLEALGIKLIGKTMSDISFSNIIEF